MILKTRIIPCLDVMDGRTGVARSATWHEDARNAKERRDQLELVNRGKEWL